MTGGRGGLDPTSTGKIYGFGLEPRVLPALGYPPIAQVTAGTIDRPIDEWEQRYGRSTIKNLIAPPVQVLDEAVRDGLLGINPAKNCAKRSLNRDALRNRSAGQVSPRAHAIYDMKPLIELAEACGRVDQPYSDFVMLAALLAARSSEVSGLEVRDVRFEKNLLVIAQQSFADKGGLITKPPKSRKERRVPILELLRPRPGTLGRGKDAWRPSPCRPEKRHAHHRDSQGCHQLGHDRRRTRPSRIPPRRSNVDGRR